VLKLHTSEQGECLALAAFRQAHPLRSQGPAHCLEHFDNLITVTQFRYLYDAIDRFIPRGATVLDWGCGRGHLSWYLLHHGFVVSAFTLEEEPAVFEALDAETRSRLTVCRQSEEDPVGLPYNDETFDAVLSCGVLEHVRETGGSEDASLQELNRILKKGGVFICSHFPNKYGYIRAAAMVALGWKHRKIPVTVSYHKHAYTKRQTLHLLSSAGFRVCEYRKYGMLPRNLFRRFPDRLTTMEHACRWLNRIDCVLEKLFPIICTAQIAVARKC